MRYANNTEVLAAFAPLAGYYDDVYHAHRCDVRPFVNIAAPSDRENVLDLGTGSAWVAIETKGRVGQGVCAGIDLCKEIVKDDAKRNVNAAGFSTKANVEPAKRISLGITDATDSNTFKAILRHWLPDDRTGFDLIMALWFFEGLPLEKRDAALRLWGSWLAPGGRIVLDVALIVNETECPATCIYSSTDALNRRRQAFQQDKIAPICMWQLYREQTTELATRCGFDIVSMHDFHNRDNCFGPFRDISAGLEDASRKAWAADGGVGDVPDIRAVQYLQQYTESEVDCGLKHYPTVYLDWKNVAVVAVLKLKSFS